MTEPAKLLENGLGELLPPRPPRAYGFKPGHSGNPGGRARSWSRAIELAREYSERSLKVMVELMENETVPPGIRLAAAISVWDRGNGKPVEAIHVMRERSERDLITWTDQELLQTIADIKEEVKKSSDTATK